MRRVQLKTRGHPGCFINEDLTRTRSCTLYRARQLKRNGNIQDTWSSDGSILIKDNSGHIHAVNYQQDLDAYSRHRSYADVVQAID